MMMALGMFVFSLPTLAYQELQRQTEWKHPGSPRVSTRDAHQYTGKGDDIISLTGWIAPELTGNVHALDTLRFMADTGKSWILIQGTGRIYGSFVITHLSEKKTELDNRGDTRRISFTITLKRMDETVPNLLGDINQLNLNNVISNTGQSLLTS